MRKTPRTTSPNRAETPESREAQPRKKTKAPKSDSGSDDESPGADLQHDINVVLNSDKPDRRIDAIRAVERSGYALVCVRCKLALDESVRFVLTPCSTRHVVCAACWCTGWALSPSTTVPACAACGESVGMKSIGMSPRGDTWPTWIVEMLLESLRRKQAQSSAVQSVEPEAAQAVESVDSEAFEAVEPESVEALHMRVETIKARLETRKSRAKAAQAAYASTIAKSVDAAKAVAAADAAQASAREAGKRLKAEYKNAAAKLARLEAERKKEEDAELERSREAERAKRAALEERKRRLEAEMKRKLEEEIRKLEEESEAPSASESALSEIRRAARSFIAEKQTQPAVNVSYMTWEPRHVARFIETAAGDVIAKPVVEEAIRRVKGSNVNGEWLGTLLERHGKSEEAVRANEQEAMRLFGIHDLFLCILLVKFIKVTRNL